jgi:tetrachlorobenzoquinone reductase
VQDMIWPTAANCSVRDKLPLIHRPLSLEAISPGQKTMTEPRFSARIVAARYEAADVLSFLIRPINGKGDVSIDPGAHIDIHLPNGLMRSYSLSNGTSDQGLYRITVARDPNSRGGSIFMHDGIRIGQMIEVSAPRNNFRLEESAALSTFVAGGIGVTPFVPMITRLNALGRKWRLHYCVRTRPQAALLEELRTLEQTGMGELLVNFDHEPGGGMLDLQMILKSLPEGAHVYCCGPTGMLDAFRTGAKSCGLPENRVHFEYFSGNVSKDLEGGFRLILQKSGIQLSVKPGETILQAVTNAGVDAPYSCEQGLCGSCATHVISGVPDHRDMMLSDQQRTENNIMMICCSGSKSPELILDL